MVDNMGLLNCELCAPFTVPNAEGGNWRSSPAFYIVHKKIQGWTLSIKTWSITMIFMQLTTQLIHYHVLICIIICYKPKGNTITLLSPLELKSDFISIEKP